jgi:stage V sporulation protein R
LKYAWANFRDESFIQQYLSPSVMRRFKMFRLKDDAREDHYTVTAIHNDQGYRDVRHALAHAHDIAMLEPDIQVADVDLLGDRHLRLQHNMRDDIPLAEKERDAVLEHARKLWGYDVTLEA